MRWERTPSFHLPPLFCTRVPHMRAGRTTQRPGDDELLCLCILVFSIVDVACPSTKSSLASLFCSPFFGDKFLGKLGRRTNLYVSCTERERKKNNTKYTVELCGCCIYISPRDPCIVFNRNPCIVSAAYFSWLCPEV